MWSRHFWKYLDEPGVMLSSNLRWMCNANIRTFPRLNVTPQRQAIIPAATVLLVASSITMKLPVARSVS
jgi:hypothetical protein